MSRGTSGGISPPAAEIAAAIPWLPPAVANGSTGAIPDVGGTRLRGGVRVAWYILF